MRLILLFIFAALAQIHVVELDTRHPEEVYAALQEKVQTPIYLDGQQLFIRGELTDAQQIAQMAKKVAIGSHYTLELVHGNPNAIGTVREQQVFALRPGQTVVEEQLGSTQATVGDLEVNPRDPNDMAANIQLAPEVISRYEVLMHIKRGYIVKIKAQFRDGHKIETSVPVKLGEWTPLKPSTGLSTSRDEVWVRLTR